MSPKWSIPEISQKFIFGVAFSDVLPKASPVSQIYFWKQCSMWSEGETAKFHHFLAHLAPKVLLVFTIHKISPSSICSPSNLVVLLFHYWFLAKIC